MHRILLALFVLFLPKSWMREAMRKAAAQTNGFTK